MKKIKQFVLGGTFALLLINIMIQARVYDDRSEPMDISWRAEFEQLCVEDTASRSGCLCAIAYVEQSSPAAELDGEVIYNETKELMKNVCLQ